MDKNQFTARILFIHNEHCHQDSQITDKDDYAFKSFQEECFELYRALQLESIIKDDEI
jgi:hypothetical protein